MNDSEEVYFLKVITLTVLLAGEDKSLDNRKQFRRKLKANATGSNVSKGISDCCNAYVKWLNTLTKRKGNLNHLAWIIWYIHRNQVHHHLTSDYSTWKYSSFNAIAGSAVTRVARNDIYDFFGGLDPYLSFHKVQQQAFLKRWNDYFLQPVRLR